MAVNFFGAPTGAGSPRTANLISGSPEYQEAIVEGQARQLQPYYRQASRDLGQQSLFAPEGVAMERDLGLRQAYLESLGRGALEASTRGADVGEQRRRIEQARTFQLQDQATQAARLKEQEAREEEAANAALWSGLITTAAGAAGNYIGGQAGGTAAATVAGQATAPEQQRRPAYRSPNTPVATGTGGAYGPYREY